MSDKPRQVDLGPMYLPLGKERPHEPAREVKPAAVGRQEDVDRFRALMDDPQGRFASPGLVAPVSLLARRGEGGAQHDDDSQNGGFVDAMERLWVSEGLNGEREVRIGLRNRILPDTAVRMRVFEGRLQVDFSCVDGEVARRLARRLEAFARELGARLDRPVVATVEHIDHGLLRSTGWSPEQP